MPTRLVIPNEIAPGERRIAIEPGVAKKLSATGIKISMQQGAALSSYFKDEDFVDVDMVADAAALYKDADLIFKVMPPTLDELNQMKDGCTIAGFMVPSKNAEMMQLMCDKKITSLAMELVPRYMGVLMGAQLAPVFFPMLTTAAGTIRPAKVLIIGVGVAGLQAIATAKRLGAIVEAYDVRSATREQVESLGGKFIDTGVSADGEGGYARELTDDEKQQQQDVLAKHIAMADVIVSTAAIPGRPSPKIISEAMVEDMKTGSVIVDLASEGGGNCELTKPGETFEYKGRVTIHGPLNVAGELPIHASEMYSKNLFNLVSPFISEE